MAFTYAGFFGPAAVQDSLGNALANIDVTVTNPDTSVASLWTDRTKATALANPVTTDSRGQYQFYAEPGQRRITANGVTRDVIVPLDPEEADLAESLLPTHVEVTAFAPPKAHTNWGTYAQSSTRFLAGERSSNGTQNAEITYELVLQQGTHTLALVYTRSSDSGIYSIYVGGVLLGTTIDGYNATTAAARTEIPGIVVPATGRVEVRLVMAAKNTLSTNYAGRLALIAATRTGV